MSEIIHKRTKNWKFSTIAQLGRGKEMDGSIIIGGDIH